MIRRDPKDNRAKAICGPRDLAVESARKLRDQLTMSGVQVSRAPLATLGHAQVPVVYGIKKSKVSFNHGNNRTPARRKGEKKKKQGGFKGVGLLVGTVNTQIESSESPEVTPHIPIKSESVIHHRERPGKERLRDPEDAASPKNPRRCDLLQT